MISIMAPAKTFRSALTRTLLALGCSLAACMPAHGQVAIPGFPDFVTDYDAREVALLPGYCPYTQLFRDHVPGGHNQEKMDYWYSVMGPSYNHMHHYCYGLMKTNRANLFARTRQARLFYLQDAVTEYEYVLRNASQDFMMLPEILTKKGENLIKLDKAPLAMLDLQRAIDLKPDYWPPYATVSDYYKANGSFTLAREWLEKGLAATSNARALEQRLAELEATPSERKSSAQRREKPASPEPAAEKTPR
jgi:hypothetical protein